MKEQHPPHPSIYLSSNSLPSISLYYYLTHSLVGDGGTGKTTFVKVSISISTSISVSSLPQTRQFSSPPLESFQSQLVYGINNESQEAWKNGAFKGGKPLRITQKGEVEAAQQASFLLLLRIQSYLTLSWTTSRLFKSFFNS